MEGGVLYIGVLDINKPNKAVWIVLEGLSVAQVKRMNYSDGT